LSSVFGMTIPVLQIEPRMLWNASPAGITHFLRHGRNHSWAFF